MVKQYIYVLALEQGKYYVGQTTNVQRRWNEHRSGQGSKWTKRYPPIDMEEHYEVPHGRNAGLEEDLKVKSMMLNHGIDNVRGGAYSKVGLTEAQSAELKQALRNAEGSCFHCGSKDHIAAQCNAATQVTNNRPSKRRKLCSKAPRGQSSCACERCGRDSHTADRCYAVRDVAGNVIQDEMYESDSSCECERCGRDSYTADQCYAGRGVVKYVVHEVMYESDVCERCGRDSHTADQCYAVRDIAGNVIRRRNCR